MAKQPNLTAAQAQSEVDRLLKIQQDKAVTSYTWPSNLKIIQF
jgi:hypothetical protein